MSNNDEITKEELDLFWEPVKTKEELAEHMRVFLDLELPDQIIDEESTSTPMDFVWDVYYRMTTNNGYARHVVAASRNCYKTLTTAVLHFYNLIHCRRDAVQISAELQQSAAALEYVSKFVDGSFIKNNEDKNNTKIKKFINLPIDNNWLTKRNDVALKVVTATKKGANSSRSSCLIFDEVDLTPPEVLGEAAYIADPERYTGFDPVFVYISSRKSNDGPIQKLIDEYENEKPEDLKLHKWSVVDTMRRCPEEVCDSTKPATAFMHMETLEVIWGQDRFDALVKEGKEVWKTISAFQDCAKCPAFVACQGRSKKQTKNYKTLRSHTATALVLKTVMSTGGSASIISQALNLKPETSAIVFAIFNPLKNVMGYIDFYKWVAGHYFNPLKLPKEEIDSLIASKDPIQMQVIMPTKQDIYNAMVNNKWTLHCGVDWGLYDPAVALLVGYHKSSRRAAVLHVEASSGYPNEDWAKYIKANIYNEMPFDLACPDMADPNSPTYFARLQIPSLNTKPSKIETGVHQIRSLLFNPFTLSNDLIILDDGDFGQNKLLIEALSKWTYQKTTTGYNYSKFEDNQYTHTIDSLRYALAPFVDKNEIKFSSHQSAPEYKITEQAAMGDKEALERIKQKQELMNQFKEHMKNEHGINDLKSPSEVLKNKPKKSGSIKFRI